MPRVTHYEIRMHPMFGAEIDCACEGGHLLRIVFVSQGYTLPNNVTLPLYPNAPELAAIQKGIAYVPLDQLPWFIDILRNEVVTAIIDLAAPRVNGLVTAAAPAGWGHFV